MRLDANPLLPQNPDTAYLRTLVFSLSTILRNIANKVNHHADGRLSAIDNAQTAAPTTGQFAQGDFIRNSTPTELGTAGSKYVLLGWVSVAGGEPGTFKECRVLTGN